MKVAVENAPVNLVFKKWKMLVFGAASLTSSDP